MRHLLNTILLSVLLFGCTGKQSYDYPHYNIKLSADPASQYLNVSGSWSIPAEDESYRLEFYLHRQLRIDKLDINGDKSFKLTSDTSDLRYMPEAVKYTLKTENPLKKRTILNFKYSGKITEWPEWSASVIGRDWTEMGLYFPWYPYNMSLKPFNYSVEVDIDDSYNIFIMGNEQKKNGHTVYSSADPTNDIVVCCSEDLKTSGTISDDYAVTIGYCTLPEILRDTLTGDMEEIMSIFNRWFPAGPRNVCLVESMREKGGGYARLGGIYLSGLEKTDYFSSRRGYTRYLSHEISHLWWYRANTNTWEDWLNEGFAEYSALMVLREKYGGEYYDKWIAMKRENSAGTGAVWHCDRNGQDAYAILYSKAPLLIAELEEKTGEEGLKQLMREMLEAGVSTTEQFLSLLEESHGSEVKNWFISRLKEA
mgnify:CR=1 FL=1